MALVRAAVGWDLGWLEAEVDRTGDGTCWIWTMLPGGSGGTMDPAGRIRTLLGDRNGDLEEEEAEEEVEAGLDAPAFPAGLEAFPAFPLAPAC